MFNEYVGLEDIEGGTGRLVSVQNEKPKSNKLKFQTGDILYGKLRPNLNKGWIATFDGICSTDFMAIRPQTISAEYLLTYLQSAVINDQIMSNITGSQLPRVSTGFLMNIDIPHPPEEAQKNIADTLNKEQRIIDANKELVVLINEKMNQVLAGIWSD